ncbi:hypothetical protein HELRODRAFT_70879 [Helobdella robusta]|uniref:RING-type domain-containing protein n=1 Tax=Helobdella robusta TaxID=6412 RepID=T1G0D5_HELRO|nr:hypothetical protein HELRODRAFT_70879 [Helobdella robusta]ESN90747.1 hypothetical protein HELRODRAFT_70879 [Helobdella robusta]
MQYFKKYAETHASEFDEIVRLLSFSNWEFLDIVTPLALANAGFYRLESHEIPDAVKCAFCHLVLINWKVTDVVIDEHRAKRANCQFIRNRASTTNVPIDPKLLFCHSYINSDNESTTHSYNNDNKTNSNNHAINYNRAMEENTRLKELRQCKVCLDKEMDTVFLPCGHFMCCTSCAAKINNCAVCRLLIRGTVNAFIPPV